MSCITKQSPCAPTSPLRGQLQPRFDHESTAVRRRSARLRIASYVIVTLMTFDKQSNGRRIEVESSL